MTARPLADAGFIPECFLARAKTRPTSGRDQVILATDGVSPGQMTVGFFTTGRRRVRMGSLGASARSWCGGMKKNGNGPGWIRRTFRPQLRLMLSPTWLADKGLRLWVGRGPLCFIRMD